MALNGIDISNHQKGLNLKDITCDFVICKATEGTTFVDKYCDGFMQQAMKLGKKVGVYHFASGKTTGKAEADFFLKNVQGYIGKAILILDWEGDAVKKGVGYAKEFLDRVLEKTGIKPMLYSYNNCINAYDWSAVKNADYGLWNAGYYNGYTEMGYTPKAPLKGGLGAWGSCAMYQYTSSGKLTGWSGHLDLDVFYGDAAAWDKYAGGSAGAGTSIAKPAPAPISAVNPTNQSMKNAQIHINNFTGAGIPEDGKNGPKTRKGLIMALQTACNMDYSSGLTVDGKIGEKTNDARDLHYVKRGEKYLLSRTDTNPALFVGCRKPFGRLGKEAIQSMLSQLGKKAHIHTHPHKFRRTLLTDAGNRGIPLQEIQSYAGHKKPDTTMMYVTVSEENVKASFRRYIA